MNVITGAAELESSVVVSSSVSSVVVVVTLNVPVILPLPVPSNPLIVGEVRVLFVSVSDPASVANDPSDSAELNCAVVPDTVFEPSAMVLFVSVSVESCSTTVPVASGSVMVLLADSAVWPCNCV